MQRATQPTPFVPGPPISTAESRANLRWFLALRAAFQLGLSDREAIEEANRLVPEALDPTLLPPGELTEEKGRRASPFLVTSIRRRTPVTLTPRAHRVPWPHDPAVHDLFVPIGEGGIPTWPGRGDPTDDAASVPLTCPAQSQRALDV